MAKVIASDIDAKTIKYASCRNRHALIDYQVQNAETFKLQQKFDVVISFETIEHLKNPELFLQNVHEVLATNGTFYVSTPISSIVQNNKPENIYHTVEWGFQKFQDIIAHKFDIKDIFLQLYSIPKKVNNKIINKILRKAGIIKTTNQSVIENLNPFKFNPQKISKEMIGTEWKGYQIIQCQKK